MVSTPLPVQQVYGGNPYRDDYEPLKTEIIQYLKALEAAIEGGDLTGLAAKSYIVAFNTRGTPNAIVADTDIPVPAQDGGALIALPIVADNTSSPVTVKFNDDLDLTIKTMAGFDPDPGALTAGMVLAGYRSGSDFRLLTDNLSSSILAAMQALRDAATFEADRSSSEADRSSTEADRATTQANRSETNADTSQTAATQAQSLVDAAQAGYTGFAPGTFYDLGHTDDPVELFPSDLGRTDDA